MCPDGDAIAVTGIACCYPGASNPRLLWENILTRRRQFRRIPDQRLPLADYHDPDPGAVDKTYGTRAAVLDGFEFDWVKWRIPKKAFESTDIVHWLALDVAQRAFADAGYAKGQMPKQYAGVILGNTLTGEQTRSQTLRLRWPYVRRVLLASARSRGFSERQAAELAETMEGYYKSVFAPITEDSLAGGLSNTIAGRICNYFDLHGGGYSVDGACSSSLIAVVTAARSLANGDLDLALAGGVDVSLDTFELIGFAKTGALSATDMRVYDRRASGFIPGEGCGFVVLKRLRDARADGDYVYATFSGWGLSSDGKGGITAPSGGGQSMALNRAYTRSGHVTPVLDFVEGHGTGTSVGDREELKGLAMALGDPGETPLRSCGITSVKSLIGHTKAAAGIAGFIKAVLAVNQRVLPPTAGCTDPNPVFSKEARHVYPILRGEVRSPTSVLRAGVSAMGFGGINSHVTLESADPPSDRLKPDTSGQLDERALLASNQESELFVLASGSVDALLRQLPDLARATELMSDAEMVDLAARMADEVVSGKPWRASIVARSPAALGAALNELQRMLAKSPPSPGETIGSRQVGVWLGNRTTPPRLGFLFPGQGSQQLNMARRLVERHPWARELIAQLPEWMRTPGERSESVATSFVEHMFKPTERALDEAQLKAWKGLLTGTETAQPAICLCSLLWLGYLERLGLRPAIVGGHSLGELTAFHAADAFDAKTLLRLAALRGEAMSASGEAAGTMASLACSRQQAQELLSQVEGYIVIANINSPTQIVVSGEKDAVAHALGLAKERNIQVRELPVSNAFHTRLVAGAAGRLRADAYLPPLLRATRARLLSGIDGHELRPGVELKEHFARQILAPVEFVSLVKAMDEACDLLVEVGPGRILSGLVGTTLGDEEKCFPVESKAETDSDLNLLLANYFARGGEVDWEALYSGRLVRPFRPAWEMSFIENQCERPLPSFAEQPLSADVAEASLPSGEATSALADMLELPADLWERYLARRGSFLAAVVKADMAYPPNVESPPQTILPFRYPVEPHPLGPIPQEAASSTLAAGERFMQLVAGQSGFPRSTLSPELRLLDDLNLDSIKAASLIAEAATQLNLAEQLDSAEYANASLGEIATVLQELATGNTAPAPLEASAIDKLLLDLVAQQTGFPRGTLTMEQRLLDDLNMDSIKAAELIAQTAGRLGIAEEFDPAQFANASLQAIADQLGALSSSQQGERFSPTGAIPVAGNPRSAKRATWVREFAFEPIEVEPSPAVSGDGSVEVTGEALILCEESELDLAQALSERMQRLGGAASHATFAAEAGDEGRFATLVAVLPRLAASSSPLCERLPIVVERLRASLRRLADSEEGAAPSTVVFVQFGGGFFGKGNLPGDLEQCCAGALAASLHLERPELKVRVLDFAVATSAENLSERVWAEVSSPERYAAVGYDEALTRRVPRPRMLEPAGYASRAGSWSSDDVVLVTGGAKGITAECVFALARETGVRLALVGSSPAGGEAPGDNGDAEVDKTLRRFREAGLTAHYYRCDVTDAEAVGVLVETVSRELGEISGVIHGAGLNKPALLGSVSSRQAISEVSPKVLGATHLCQALERAGAPLKMFLGFSSIIGLTGMQRNGWYAFSNEALSLILAAFRERHPACAVLSLAFSIWDEVGMGARMGSTAYLAKLGIAPIPVAEGVARFLRLVTQDPGVHEVVTTARLGGLDTWAPAESSLDSRCCRFLEQIVAYVPGVETIARARLSLESDPYLRDHVWRDSHLFPTVFGLEAMAQAVAHVTGETDFDTFTIEDVDLARPIVVDVQNGTTIEIRAEVLERDDEHPAKRVKAEIAVEQTGFARAHFSCVFVLDAAPQIPEVDLELPAEPLDIEPRRDLYGWLLFQGDAFQRIRKVYVLDSGKALIASGLESRAVGEGDPGQRLLGDAYFRDSMLQSIQLPLTQELCLPVALERIERYAVTQGLSATAFILASVEEKRDREVLATIIAMSEEGRVLERIRGRMRILEHRSEHPTPETLAMGGKFGQYASWQEAMRRDAGKLLPEKRETAGTDLIYSHGAAIERADDGRPVLVVRFPVTFREAANTSRTLYFSHYFAWIGKLRETIVEPVSADMMELFSSGEWGMVTNSAETLIGGDASSGDVIEGLAWIESLSGSADSTVEMCFQWHKLLPSGETELLATSRMRSTWVAIRGPGLVEARPFPEFGRRFLDRYLPLPLRRAEPAEHTSSLSPADFGHELFCAPPGPAASSSLLNELTFDTSLEDANLVGNLYFANYSVWQGRVFDHYFHDLSSKTGKVKGEFRCVSCRIDHLQEAMPFDRILVRMYLRAVNERGIRLYFDYFRLAADGQRNKIAFAEQQAAWYEPGVEGRWEPAELPAALRTCLTPKSKHPPGKRSAKAERQDVVVVGAGIGGLAAAALLAKRGRKVVVLEQHNKPGGFCTSWSRSVPKQQRNGAKPLKFVFDAGVQDVFGVTPGGNLHSLLRELDIADQIEWRRVMHEYIQSDLRLKVPWSQEGFKAELATRFPHESEGLSAFFAEVEACNRVIYRQAPSGGNGGSATGSVLARWANQPFATMLHTYIHDERLRHLLSVLTHYITDDPTTLDALAMCPVFAYYTQGGYYPLGGAQVLPDALVSVIKRHGGELRLRTPVSRILVKQGRAAGVRLADGSVLEASEVIANADVRQTYLELVGRENLTNHFVQGIENLRPSCSAFMVMLGVDMVPEAEPLTVVLDEEGRATQVGTLSKVDPSLAPPGHSRILLSSLIANTEAGLWDRGSPDYAERKQRYGDALIKIAEQAIPGLSRHIVLREDASPATFARYAWASDGAVYGLDMCAMRPSVKTPIQNLSIVGAGVAPRPGVEDAVRTGMKAADAIQRSTSSRPVSG